jgi:hypothetical protein
LTTKITKIFRRLIRSRFALALPVTFLILFVTTLGLVSATYYFSIQRIGSESQMVKIETAKQDFLSLDDKICSTVWSPGSSSTIAIKDSEGLTRIQPTNNQLEITVNDTANIQDVLFNSTTGQVVYELPYSGTSQSGLFLQGDNRAIVNQTGSTQSQVSIVTGAEHPEIHLSYRPVVSCFNAGIENGKEVNDIRIYIINLNSSASIDTYGELPLKISCLDPQLITKTYDLPYQTHNLEITCAKEDSTGKVLAPISSTSQGAIVNIEIVVVNVSIERWLR